MEPPKKADIDTAILNLKMLGALLPTVSDKISHEDGDITVLGQSKLDIWMRRYQRFSFYFQVF